jgi:hypothetical protein
MASLNNLLGSSAKPLTSVTQKAAPYSTGTNEFSTPVYTPTKTNIAKTPTTSYTQPKTATPSYSPTLKPLGSYTAAPSYPSYTPSYPSTYGSYTPSYTPSYPSYPTSYPSYPTSYPSYPTSTAKPPAAPKPAAPKPAAPPQRTQDPSVNGPAPGAGGMPFSPRAPSMPGAPSSNRQPLGSSGTTQQMQPGQAPQMGGQQQQMPQGLAQLASMMMGMSPGMSQSLAVNMPFNQELPFQVGHDFGGDGPYISRSPWEDATGALGRSWG